MSKLLIASRIGLCCLVEWADGKNQNEMVLVGAVRLTIMTHSHEKLLWMTDDDLVDDECREVGQMMVEPVNVFRSVHLVEKKSPRDPFFQSIRNHFDENMDFKFFDVNKAGFTVVRCPLQKKNVRELPKK